MKPGAPIICCTAEILANVALRDGGSRTGEDAISHVVMDEFHFYADPQRGWAWQVPLLELPGTQFLLMSATLGDTSFFTEDLEKRTGRDVALVTSAQRPVPLNFEYVLEPLGEVVEDLVHTHRAPVYIVHFTQKDAVDRAQSLLSMNVATRFVLEPDPTTGAALVRSLRSAVLDEPVGHGLAARYRRWFWHRPGALVVVALLTIAAGALLGAWAARDGALFGQGWALWVVAGVVVVDGASDLAAGIGLLHRRRRPRR